MSAIIRKLALGIALIIVMSAILLLSDVNHRKTPQQKPGSAGKIPRSSINSVKTGAVGAESAATRRPEAGRLYKIGLVYFAPDPGADIVIGGIFDGLRQSGFVQGKNLDVRQSHAQGEIANITGLLQNYDGSDVDLIMTLTTPCLTAACATVKKKPVVFSYVYDPIAAGAGKTLTEHLPYLTGIGSFPPLGETLAAFRQVFPGMKAVGAIYNSSEANSRKVMEVARGLFARSGIRIEEMTVTTSSEVYQAAQVLSRKNIDALWVAGDNTVIIAFDAVAKVAAAARLPLLSNDAENPEKGVLFSIQIGFYRPGLEAGFAAARVMLGENTAGIPIRDIAVPYFEANFGPAKSLGITFPEDLLKKCANFYNLHDKLGRPAKIAMVQVVGNPEIEDACEGVIKGLEDSKLKQGEDFTVQRFNAQNDISELNLIMTTVKSQGADLVVTAGTPAMIAAARMIKDIPIVFTVASDPRVVGVFDGDQRPANLVGVNDDPDLASLVELAIRNEPAFDTVGTIWDPSQPNSEISVKRLRKACLEKGIRLLEATPASVSGMNEATEDLCHRNAKVIFISADNLAATGLPAILNTARKHGVPIYTTEPGMVDQGAAAAIGDDYLEWGRQSGRLAAKVLAGVKPRSLPFEKTTAKKTRVASINLAENAPGKKWKISLVRYNDSHFAEEAAKGLDKGFADARLILDRDYVLDTKSAQGDIVTLNTIFDAIKTQGTDLIVVFATPPLQAAIRKFDSTPIIFSVVANPIIAGAGKTYTDHRPNITGIATLSDFDGMAGILKECLPDARRVGTLFVPSEINSVFYKNRLAAALERRGISLEAVPADTSNEYADAARSLASRDLDAVCQIADNLSVISFPTIAKAAADKGLPVFAFESSLAKQGAAVVLSRDFYDAGREAALLAARIMRGANPATIPFDVVSKTTLIVNLPQASKAGMKIPESIISRAQEVIR